MKTSDEMGGKEATRRFRLYRLGGTDCQLNFSESGILSNKDLLPVTPHVTFLQVIVTEGNLTSIAGIRVGSSGIHLGLIADDGRSSYAILLCRDGCDARVSCGERK